MTTWRNKLARSAWAAFLLLFAIRAIAGTALCQSYGDHRAPQSAPNATEARAHIHHATHEHASRSEQPSDDRQDHVCEEPAYLIGDPVLLSPIKVSLTADAMPWLHAPGRDWKLVLEVVSVPPPPLAHPPPSRAPLDISPRLRI